MTKGGNIYASLGAASGQLGWQIGTEDFSSRFECSRKYVNNFGFLLLSWDLVFDFSTGLCPTSGLVLLYLVVFYLEERFSRYLSLVMNADEDVLGVRVTYS